VPVAICRLSEEWKLSLVIYHHFLRSFNRLFFLLKLKACVDAFVQGLQVRLIIQIFLGFFPDRRLIHPLALFLIECGGLEFNFGEQAFSLNAISLR